MIIEDCRLQKCRLNAREFNLPCVWGIIGETTLIVISAAFISHSLASHASHTPWPASSSSAVEAYSEKIRACEQWHCMTPCYTREYKSDEMTFMLGDKELSKEMAHGIHSQMEFDGIGGTQSEPGAVEFDSIGASLFGELHHRGRVVRVREVTYNTQPAPTIEDPDVKIDFSSMAPLHHTCVSSSPANDPMINIQGTTGMSSAMPAQQWQIQANNTSGMAGEDVHGAITSSYSNAPTCLLQGMAGYDVWSMLPSHLKGISGSCTTRPFEWRNPDEMIWHPENESDEDHSVGDFDYLNLVRAPSSIYEPIYRGSTVCADLHLKAYNARRMHAFGTSGIMHSSDDQSSTSVLVHSSSIILPDYHVLKLSGSDHTGTSMHG